jgi:hypothetical protein
MSKLLRRDPSRRVKRIADGERGRSPLAIAEDSQFKWLRPESCRVRGALYGNAKAKNGSFLLKKAQKE